MNAEFFRALDDLEKEKGIPKVYMLEKIEQALLTAYRRNTSGSIENAEVEIDWPSRSLEDIVQNKTEMMGIITRISKNKDLLHLLYFNIISNCRRNFRCPLLYFPHRNRKMVHFDLTGIFSRDILYLVAYPKTTNAFHIIQSGAHRNHLEYILGIQRASGLTADPIDNISKLFPAGLPMDKMHFIDNHCSDMFQFLRMS